MAQPLDKPGGIDTPPAREEHPEQISFTLLVVSPSVGVESPLTFPQLPASTTVKQLKAKIRDALPSTPVDEWQRLIHRGRMLGRDGETMLDIFGQDALAKPETQTLHLVLRPATTDGPSTQPPILAPQGGPQRQEQTPLPQLLQPRPQSTPANPILGMQTQNFVPGFQQLQQQHHIRLEAEQVHNLMAQRIQQLTRDSQRLHQEMGNLEQRHRAQVHPGGALNSQHNNSQSPLLPQQGSGQLSHLPMRLPTVPPAFQSAPAQHQRERAAEARQVAQDGSGNVTPSGLPRPTSSGRASPSIRRPENQPNRPREVILANGEVWRDTVFPATHTQHHHFYHHHHTGHPGNANPVLDIQAVLRNADRVLAAQQAQNGIQQTVPDLPPATAGSSSTAHTPATSGLPATNSSVPSFLPTPPEFHANWPVQNANSTTVNPNATSSALIEPMVYILSSPTGPRALLVNNSETFFTPRQLSRRLRNESPGPRQIQVLARDPADLPELRNRATQRAIRRGNAQNHENAPNGPIAVPHRNPGAGAMVAQIGPALWLMIRLMGFVWFFTAGNTSWARWFMVSGLALIVFLVNTGIFNGVAEQIWGPIRRHLEALIPLAGADAALIPAVNAAIPQPRAAPAAAGTDGRERVRGADAEPDPAQVAARLLNEHRQANGRWFMTQIRRAEHAMLLFLASLVPGVGERHIAAREAEAAERQNRLDASLAAQAALDDSNGPAQGGSPGDETRANGENPDENQENHHPPAPAADDYQPLVNI